MDKRKLRRFQHCPKIKNAFIPFAVLEPDSALVNFHPYHPLSLPMGVFRHSAVYPDHFCMTLSYKKGALQ